MQRIERRRIDWRRTGIRLKNLRDHHPALQRYTCYINHAAEGNCSAACESCEFDLDRNVSRAELARVLATTESVIANWESGRTSPELEDLLYYAAICGIALEDILVFL